MDWLLSTPSTHTGLHVFTSLLIAGAVVRILNNQIFTTYFFFDVEMPTKSIFLAFLAIFIYIIFSNIRLYFRTSTILCLFIYILLAILGLAFKGEILSLDASPYVRHMAYALIWGSGYLLAYNGAFGNGSLYHQGIRNISAVIVLLTAIAFLYLGMDQYMQWIADSLFNVSTNSGQIQINYYLTGQQIYRFSWPGMDATLAVNLLFVMLLSVIVLESQNRRPSAINFTLVGVLTFLLLATLSRRGIIFFSGFVVTSLMLGLFPRSMKFGLLGAIFGSVIYMGPTFFYLRLESAFITLFHGPDASWMVGETSGTTILDFWAFIDTLLGVPFWGTGISARESLWNLRTEIFKEGVSSGLLLMSFKMAFFLWPVIVFFRNYRAISSALGPTIKIFFVGYLWLAVYALSGVITANMMLLGGILSGLFAYGKKIRAEGQEDAPSTERVARMRASRFIDTEPQGR